MERIGPPLKSTQTEDQSPAVQLFRDAIELLDARGTRYSGLRQLWRILRPLDPTFLRVEIRRTVYQNGHLLDTVIGSYSPDPKNAIGDTVVIDVRSEHKRLAIKGDGSTSLDPSELPKFNRVFNNVRRQVLGTSLLGE